MKKETKEWITGIIIGIVISLLLAVKAIAAPVSEEDAELLAKTVEAEAGNQSIEGKRLVCAVILNRVDHEAFPDSVEKVLSQPNQFTTFKKLGYTDITWQDQLAVQMELERRSNTEVLFFNCGGYIPNTTKLYKIEDHYFSTL